MSDLGTAFLGTMAAFKSVMDAAQGVIKLREGEALRQGLEELRTKLYAAQTSALAANEERAAAVERVDELEKELTQVKAWEAESQRYKLTTVTPGAAAYSLKPGSEGDDPPHWLCPACYQNAKKSILQSLGQMPDRTFHAWACPVCKCSLRVRYSVKPGSEADAST
jgi:hypothetical protein